MLLRDSFDGVDDVFVQTGNGGDEHKSAFGPDDGSIGSVIGESIAKIKHEIRFDIIFLK